MSICGGIAGNRGRNPKGIFIHNDAGSQNANAAFYRNWLPTHDLGNGFAHYYVAADGILQAEDDWNRAWHCGDMDGNNEYLGIEVCQSMGDLENFKANEEKALALAAQKCKQYGITPSSNTIRLHQEVYATACPHRSVEIHGGRDATKALSRGLGHSWEAMPEALIMWRRSRPRRHHLTLGRQEWISRTWSIPRMMDGCRRL